MFSTILNDLRGRFGDKIYLSPEDLAPVLDISTGQQANLRSDGRFPIPTKKVGGRVKVSIYDLAKHLAGECEESVSTELAKEPPAGAAKSKKESRARKKAKRGLLEKNWWLFRCGSVISLIDEALLKSKIGGRELPLNERPPNPL